MEYAIAQKGIMSNLITHYQIRQGYKKFVIRIVLVYIKVVYDWEVIGYTAAVYALSDTAAILYTNVAIALYLSATL